MNQEVDTWEMLCLYQGVDPGSREEYEYIYTAWACGFEEEDYRLDI